MKLNPIFQHYLNCDNESEIFQYFHNTLTDSMTLWDYFVNWQKVLTNIQDIEIHLNTINYLVGKYPHCKNYLTKKKSKLFNF